MKATVVGLNYSPEPTGIAVYTSSLAAGLAREGVTVRAVCGYPHYPQWRIHEGYGGLTLREDLAGVKLTRLRHYVPSRPALANRLLMEVTFGLRSICSRWGRPDVVVLVSPALFAAGLASLRAKLTRTPRCVWVQDIYSLGLSESGGGGGRLARILRSFERRILGSACGIVVIHERFKRYLVEELGLEAGKIEVIRNWSHLSGETSVDVPAVRESLGWQPDDIVVLHAGNMGAKQGLENVVNASRLAAERGSRVRFVLLGDGNQRGKLQAMGANSRLDFLAPLPAAEFEGAIAAADILLVNERPGLTEMSVPSKLTSYFSTGRPVIAATDASSITAEEVARAGAGVRVDADSAEELLEAAERLGIDQAGSAEFGAAARAFRQEHLSEVSAVRRFNSTLRRLAQGHD